MNAAAVPTKPRALSVSELCLKIHDALEDVFPEVWVEGEISNFRLYPSGHAYLTLKDENAQIAAVLFRGAAAGLKFKLEDGLKILARGRVSVYSKRGGLQIVLSHVEPLEKGGLRLAFEQLKARLEKEGLFDPERKKALPPYPRKIGVVTSLQGAALRDILSILKRRAAWSLDVMIIPTRVQGEGAALEIAAAIEDVNRFAPETELLLVGRGGGSLEDLWAFNEEATARAIAGSRIPIISCVGHETDFTIADFVADLRAPTPSAAAETALPDRRDVERKIAFLFNALVQPTRYRLSDLSKRLSALSSRPVLKSPLRAYEEWMRRLDELASDLSKAALDRLLTLRKEIAFQGGRLDALSPLKVLSRGYAVARLWPSLKILRVARDVQARDLLRLSLFQGEIFCEVKDAERI